MKRREKKKKNRSSPTLLVEKDVYTENDDDDEASMQASSMSSSSLIFGSHKRSDGGGDATAATAARTTNGSSSKDAVTAREYLPHLFWVSGDADERREHRIDRFRSLLDQQHSTEEKSDAERFFVNFALQSHTETQMLDQLTSIHSLRSHFARVLRERNEELEKRLQQRQREALDQQKIELELSRSIASDVKLQDLQWFALRADAVRDAETELIAKTCLDSVFSLAELAMSYSAYQEDIVAHRQAAIPSPILEDLWTLFLTGSGIAKFENYLRLVPSSSARSTSTVPPNLPAPAGTTNSPTDPSAAAHTPAATSDSIPTPNSLTMKNNNTLLGNNKHHASIEESGKPSHAASKQQPTTAAAASKEQTKSAAIKSAGGGGAAQKGGKNNKEEVLAAVVDTANQPIVKSVLCTPNDEYGDLEIQDFMRYLNRSGPWSAAAVLASLPQHSQRNDGGTAEVAGGGGLNSATKLATNTAAAAGLADANASSKNYNTAQQQLGTVNGNEHAVEKQQQSQQQQQQLPTGGSGLTTNIFHGASTLNFHTPANGELIDALHFSQQPLLRNDLLGKFITDLINFRRKPITPPDHIAAPTAPIKLAILGKPLSGKTFLARYLSHVYGFKILNMQNLVRDYIKQQQILADEQQQNENSTTTISYNTLVIDEKLGEEIENELFSGEGLQPTTAAALVLDAMKNRLTAGWILDGYPGTLTQARLLQRELNGFDVEKVQESYERQTSVLAGDQSGIEMPKLLTELLDLVIVIDVPDNEIADRVASKLYPTPTQEYLTKLQKQQQLKSACCGGENSGGGGDVGASSESEALLSVLKKLENNALEYNALHDRITSFGIEYKHMEPVLMEFSCNVIHVDGRRPPEDLIRRVDALISARIQARVDAYAEPLPTSPTSAASSSHITNHITVKSDCIIKSQLELPSFEPPSSKTTTTRCSHNNTMQKYPPLKTIVVQSKPGDNTCRRGTCDEEFETLRRKGIRRQKHQQQQQHSQQQPQTLVPPTTSVVEPVVDTNVQQQLSPPAASTGNNAAPSSAPVVADAATKSVKVSQDDKAATARSAAKRSTPPKASDGTSAAAADAQNNNTTNTTPNASSNETTTKKGRNAGGAGADKRHESTDRTFASASVKPSRVDNAALSTALPLPMPSIEPPKHIVPPMLTMASDIDEAHRQYQQKLANAAAEHASETAEDSFTMKEESSAFFQPPQATFEEIRRLLNYTSDQDTSSFDLSSNDEEEEEEDYYGGDAEKRRQRKQLKQQSNAAQQQQLQQNTNVSGSRGDSPRMLNNKSAAAAAAAAAEGAASKTGRGGKAGSTAAAAAATAGVASDATNKAIAATQAKKNDDRTVGGKNAAKGGGVEEVVAANSNSNNRHTKGRSKMKQFLTHCLAEPDPLASDSSSISSFSEDELDSSEYDFEEDFYAAYVQHNLRHAPQQVAEAEELRAMADTITNSDYNRRVVGYYHRHADQLERWRAERDSVRQIRAKRKYDIMQHQNETDPAVRLAAYYTAHKKRSRRESSSTSSAYFPGAVRIPATGVLASLVENPSAPDNNAVELATTEATGAATAANNMAGQHAVVTSARSTLQLEQNSGKTAAGTALGAAHVSRATSAKHPQPHADTAPPASRERRSSQKTPHTVDFKTGDLPPVIDPAAGAAAARPAAATNPDAALTSLSYELDSAQGTQILQLWQDIEAHYLSTTMRVFSEQRKVYRDIMVESYRLRSQFSQVLLAHQHQLRHPIFRYQARFNGIAPWKRVRSEFKAWMHHDVDNCNELLRETSEINRRKALGVLFDIKASGWLEDRLGLLMNACVELEQAELEFLANIAFMLREYFNALCEATEFLDSETIYANVPFSDLLVKISSRSRTAGQGGSESMGSGSGSSGVQQQTTGGLTIGAGALMVTSTNTEGASSASAGGRSGAVSTTKEDASSKQGGPGKKDGKAGGLGHTQSAHTKPGKNPPPVQETEIQIVTVPRKFAPHSYEHPNIAMLISSGSAHSGQQHGTFATTGPAALPTPGSANSGSKSKSQNRLSATTGGNSQQQNTLTAASAGANATNAGDNTGVAGGQAANSSDEQQQQQQHQRQGGVLSTRDHFLGDADELMIDEATANALELLKLIAINEIDNVVNRSNAQRKAAQDEIDRIKREKTMPPPSGKGGKKGGGGGGGGKADKHAKEKDKDKDKAAAATAAAAAAADVAAALAAAHAGGVSVALDADGNLIPGAEAVEDPIKVHKHAELVATLTQKYEACLRPAAAIAAQRIRAIQAYTRVRVMEIKQIMRQMYNHFDYLLERQHHREAKSLRKLMLHLHSCVESEQGLGQLVRIDAGSVRMDSEQAWPLADFSNSQPDKEVELFKPRGESKFDPTRLRTHFANVADAAGFLSFSDTLHDFVHVAHCRYNTQLIQLNPIDQPINEAWHRARTGEYEKVAYECFGDKLVQAPEGVDTILPEINLQTIDTRLEVAIKRIVELAAGSNTEAGSQVKSSPGKENEQQRGGSSD